MLTTCEMLKKLKFNFFISFFWQYSMFRSRLIWVVAEGLEIK